MDVKKRNDNIKKYKSIYIVLKVAISTWQFNFCPINLLERMVTIIGAKIYFKITLVKNYHANIFVISNL